MQDESQPVVADLEAPVTDSFDLMGVENPSFAVLQAGRAATYRSSQRADSFRRMVEALNDQGEEGRRKGLGLWVLGKYERSAAQLAAYEGDDVADFTRARALASIGRFAEAEPLFARLVQAYSAEPRPRGGLLEVQLELWLQEAGEDGAEAVADRLEKALDEAPDDFLESAEGRYLMARLCELGRDFERALDHYAAARELDPTLRPALVKGAYLAERCGLDYLAIQLYETAVRTHNADRAVLLNLGVLYEDQGRDPQAAACYDTVLRHDPTDERARLYLEDARSAMEMYYDEDLERKEDKLNQILRIPISDFELSVRARNCLNKMQLHTLGDLVCKSEQELLSYKNFGETSLNEIKEILRSKGLRLGMPREEAVASIEARARRQAPDDTADINNRPITDLQLSIRARRAVELLGCLTLGDVTKHSADELLGMQNFGTTSLQELRSKLTEMGLKLAGD
jgi:DNA-directed RNA polymerase subunit alpha